MIGLPLAGWQQRVLADSLAERADGKYAAKQVAINVPRQNGKGNILAARELFGLVMGGDGLVIHTAHEFDTSREHFLRISQIIESCHWLDAKVKAVQVANGVETIKFKNGNRLKFKARKGGSGRGFSGDLVVMDEAMIMSPGALASLIPTMSARPNPQVWFAGSAPLKDDPKSDDWRRIITSGRGGDGDAYYVEWSCPPGSDTRDLNNIAAANPNLNITVTVDWIESVERSITTDEEFGIERLGMWSPEDDASSNPLDMDAWRRSEVHGVPAEWLTDVCFGVEGTAGNDWVAVVAAGRLADGAIGIEVVKQMPGTDWLLPWAELADETHNPSAWVFDPRSDTADVFVTDFEAAGLPVVRCGMKDRALFRATASFADDLRNDRLRIAFDDILFAAARNAAVKPYGESWLIGAHAKGIKMSPLRAALLARFGVVEEPEPAPVPFLVYH